MQGGTYETVGNVYSRNIFQIVLSVYGFGLYSKSMECTLQSIGLQKSTSVATNVLLENVHESNLVSDISRVDYLEGNLGETDLEAMEGLPPFVDDIYIFGFCSKEEIVCNGRRVCFDADTKAAGKVVRFLSAIFAQAIPGKKMYDIAIQNTIRTNAKGTICKTIAAIERTTDGETRKRWLEMHTDGEKYTYRIQDQHAIAAIFVAKADLSEYNLEETRRMLPRLRTLLEANAYSLYSVDYTQDFSGTMDREKLVEHLQSVGCVEQGTFGDALDSMEATILDNTKSVGEHVCTWIHTYKGHTIREKLYNKIVCQFEAGKVQQSFGGHLAEFAACPNKHLRKTFEHAASKERGITRLEISIYGCSILDPLEYAEEIQRQTIAEMEGKMLFRIQSIANHWKNFSNAIDRCCLFVDHTKESVFVCWYGHVRTGRLGGVIVPVGKKDIERVARACIADFGFHSCPIFRIDLQDCVEDTLVFGNLRCYTKDAGATTILCPTKKPTKRYLGEEEPSTVLFPNKHIHWVWRKNTTRIGLGKLHTEIEEIATSRKISLLPKREREVLLDSIAMEEEERRWLVERREYANALVAKRKQEVQDVAETLERKKETIQKLEECSSLIIDTLGCEAQRVYDLEDLPKTFRVLGYRQTHSNRYTSGKIYVLRHKEECLVVWATKRLDEILGKQKSMVLCKKPNVDTQAYIDYGEGNIELEIQPKRSFHIRGIERFYCPIRVVEIPDAIDILLVDEEADKIKVAIHPPNMQLVHRESTPKERKTKLDEFAEGEYLCNEYSTFQFRGNNRYILYLGEQGRPAIGYWIDEEMRKLGGEMPNAPMLCRVGKIGTTKNGKKERRIAFSVGEQEEKESFPPIPKLEEI